MDIIKNCKSILMEYEDIIFAYIFGSYAQNSIRENSDIDISIYLKKNIDIDTYLEIKMNLSEVLKREVDLVILNNAPPLLKYEIYNNRSGNLWRSIFVLSSRSWFRNNWLFR